MPINITGTSVKGRQVIRALPAGCTDWTLLLTNGDQANQYRYKGGASVEDLTYTIAAQLSFHSIYWSGTQKVYDPPYPFPVTVVAYWQFDGLLWRFRANP